jgi:drug/metabolite transporter (DMT)-like permease
VTLAALALILTAAGLHAWWNLAAKRARSGLPFVSATSLVIAPLYVPVVIAYVWWRHPVFDWSAAWIIAVSSLLKMGYALFLQRAYARGDFSLVYPLARGTGPLLAVVAAVLFLGERPTPLAVCGTLVIVASIYALTGGHRLLHPDRAHLRAGVFYGLATGAFIAAYTVWDAHGVAGRGIPPVLFDAGTAWTSLLLLAPFSWRRRPEIAALWRSNRREILTVALLSPVAYVLALTAMTFTPVSYVAPAREVSMLIGAILGARLLGEGDLRRRLLAAAGMVAGVVLLALN